MISVKFPIDVLTQLASEARLAVSDRMAGLLDQLGKETKELQEESFELLAAGRQESGIQWKPLTPSYLRRKIRQGYPEKIGVRTGRMVESLKHKVFGSTVTVEYDALQAAIFERTRPLFPDQFPADWMEELEDDCMEWAEDILAEKIKEVNK